MATLTTEAPYWCRMTVYREEDWYDPIPPLINPETLDPFDLTGKLLELYVRPSFDHSLLLRKLSSASSDGILIEDAEAGQAAFWLHREIVDACFPIGDKWEQFLLLTYTDALLGSVRKTLWRGPFVALPGRTS